MVAQSILRRPIVTEKSTLLQEERTYVFEVAPEANKQEIWRAVEAAFDVKVQRVNTLNVLGKRKRYGARLSRQRSWKKAIVTLAPGESITIFEGV